MFIAMRILMTLFAAGFIFYLIKHRRGDEPVELDIHEFDSYGINVHSGYNLMGLDENGFDMYGYDANGYGLDGLNAEGYDANGYDINGYDMYGNNIYGDHQ